MNTNSSGTVSGSPLHLLLSRTAATAFGERIRAVLSGIDVLFVDPEDARASNDVQSIDIAFLTRDVTGHSTKSKMADSLIHFHNVMRNVPSLKWVQIHAAGANRPIYSELRGRGVLVTTGSGANAVPVAHMAVTGLLMLARKFPQLMDAQRRKVWQPLNGSQAPKDINGQTAVIIGLGPVGTKISHLLRSFGMHVIGVRRSSEDCPHVDITFPFTELGLALSYADSVVLACPLTSETKGLLNAATLAKLPRGARLVNVARGGVVLEPDLVAALKDGHISGAFLDVTEFEPLEADSELWGLPNVIITPHTASHTAGHYEAVGELFLNNLQRWREGKSLSNLLP